MPSQGEVEPSHLRILAYFVSASSPSKDPVFAKVHQRYDPKEVCQGRHGLNAGSLLTTSAGDFKTASLDVSGTKRFLGSSTVQSMFT